MKGDDAVGAIAKSTDDGTVVITDPLNGLCVVYLEPADTASLEARTTLVWDVQITDASDRTWTVDSGELHVMPDVTTCSRARSPAPHTSSGERGSPTGRSHGGCSAKAEDTSRSRSWATSVRR